nr:SdiA-regulated domain-containing protein [uncultured Marinifilum sp.]
MKKIIRATVFFIIFAFFLEACAKQKEDDKMIYLFDNYSDFPYDIYEPTKVFKLKDQLREISGLTYYDDKSLLCINDEKGIVYKYHLKKKEVTKEYEFDKSGDYEGIERIGSLVYVLRSDGNLFEVDHLKDKNISSVKLSTFLNAGNDTEGLAYDSESNSLLIACKGNPAKNNRYKGKRSIYRYSLDKHELQNKPFYLIDQNEIRKLLKFNGYARFSVKLLENINPSQGDLTFQPSAIAIHPITKNIYVLGSVGKLLLVLHPNGKILSIVKLKRKIFRQPEGICFSPDGTMFISNEGKGSKGNILKFKYKN